MKIRFKLEVSNGYCDCYDTLEKAIDRAKRYYGCGYRIINSVTKEIIVKVKTPVYTED